MLQDDERDRLKSRIAESLQRQGMALVAHYYVDGDIQDLAEQTGGCVSDSLEMARLAVIILRSNWWWRGFALWAKQQKFYRRKSAYSCPR